MTDPCVIKPSEHAVYTAEKMGKATIFASERLLVGLNAFEPGQSHALHAHAGMDKVYSVVEGEGLFLLEGRELVMRTGDLLVARKAFRMASGTQVREGCWWSRSWRRRPDPQEANRRKTIRRRRRRHRTDEARGRRTRTSD